MTEIRRYRMLTVCDGNTDVLPWLHFLDRFRRCDEMLLWLIEHRYTGSNFLSWARSPEAKGSMLEMARFILKRMEREKGGREILYTRDLTP